MLTDDLDLARLRALAAAVRFGTFDAAARELHVTPSALSQRIKALESAAGRVLLVRSRARRRHRGGRGSAPPGPPDRAADRGRRPRARRRCARGPRTGDGADGGERGLARDLGPARARDRPRGRRRAAPRGPGAHHRVPARRHRARRGDGRGGGGARLHRRPARRDAVPGDGRPGLRRALVPGGAGRGGARRRPRRRLQQKDRLQARFLAAAGSRPARRSTACPARPTSSRPCAWASAGACSPSCRPPSVRRASSPSAAPPSTSPLLAAVGAAHPEPRRVAAAITTAAHATLRRRSPPRDATCARDTPRKACTSGISRSRRGGGQTAKTSRRVTVSRERARRRSSSCA